MEDFGKLSELSGSVYRDSTANYVILLLIVDWFMMFVKVQTNLLL